MIQKTIFGTVAGRPVVLYTIKNENAEVAVMDLGASVQSIKLPLNGKMRELTLGFDFIEPYAKYRTFFGAVVGRVANRIAGGRITLDGKTYELPKNDNGICLHSGLDGYDRRVFDSRIDGDAVVFTLDSPDGDQGFPGRLLLTVTYRLTGSALTVTLDAVADKTTVFAPTLHTFFDLAGELDKTMLYINADGYTPTDASRLPIGVMPVKGTAFDFTSPTLIGDGLNSGDAQIELAGGYDHNFALNGEHAATATGGGIKLDVYTNLPGLQLYTANFLNGVLCRNGTYDKHSAFCLEPQFFPNAINADFDVTRPVIKAGEHAVHYVKYEFEVIKEKR